MRSDAEVEPRRLIASCLELQDDPRPLAEIVSDVCGNPPLWIAVANFQSRALDLLATLPRPCNIYWRIEFMGRRAAPFLHSAAVDPSAFAATVTSLGHRITPYSFNAWNLTNTVERLPALRDHPFAIQPIAQKPTPADVAPLKFTKVALGVAAHVPLIGAAGVHEPGKQIDEVADWILRHATSAQPLAGLFFLITDENPSNIIADWRAKAGANEHALIFVRKGDYKEWSAMQAFYRAVDIVVINSISDSWGRIVTEAAGAGTPVFIRKGDCGTDKLLPGAELFSSLEELTLSEFMIRAQRAAAFTAAAKRYVEEHYSASRVEAAWLANLTARTPIHQRRYIPGLMADNATGDLADMIFW